MGINHMIQAAFHPQVTLEMPVLILPAVQINIRAGE
jgi:hypothetical protein